MSDELQTSTVKGSGAFAFRKDGTPLLVKSSQDDRSRLELWDLAKSQVMRTFPSPLSGKSAVRASTMTSNGSTVVASIRAIDGKGELSASGVTIAWDATTGRELFRKDDQVATCVALAPDATLLAAGHEDGRTTVWSLPTGELLATLKAGRNTINCLTFGRDPVRRKGPMTPGSGWLLATGDAGDVVTIWDFPNRVPRAYCRGSVRSSEVLVLAFSPDGMTLASAGRIRTKLWDVASGRSLLDLHAGNFVPALAFSPDGRRIAVGSVAAFGWAPSVQVWELEIGRGIQALRGLTAQSLKTVFTSDARLVAGLSNDGQVGIWDRTANRLLHVLEVTPGRFPDNAALAFSPDGRRLAFSAGHEASLWDVETGAVLQTWPLPEGLVESLAFPAADQLLLYRQETVSGEGGPFTGYPPQKYPRVCRRRNLLGHDWLRPLVEFHDCNLHIFYADCSPDGKYYVIEGQGGAGGQVVRIARLYDGETGKPLGPLPTQLHEDRAGFLFDPQGKVLNFFYRTEQGERRSLLLEVPSRVVLRHFDRSPDCTGPQGKRWATSTEPTVNHPGGLSFFDDHNPEPYITFIQNPGVEGSINFPRFSPDGLRLMWGNNDGSITVVDLVEVQRRLAEVGLGW